MYPQLLSGAQIQRRLGVSNNTAGLLKKRLMLFWTNLLPAIKKLTAEQLSEAWKGNTLQPIGEDISHITANKPVVSIDTQALFSASQRSNGHLARKKHTGQTASIYLSVKVAMEKGKTQIGSLIQTVAIKQGPVFLSSVRDNKQKSIAPNLSWLPYGCVVMADQGFPYLRRYRNLQFREVNHTARAKDTKRNKWGRDRWSKNGVNNQAAEGVQRILKYSMLSAHSYIRPENMPLHLDEFSAIKGVKVYGLNNIYIKYSSLGNVSSRYRVQSSEDAKTRCDGWLRQQIALHSYKPPTLEDRKTLNLSQSRKQIRGNLKKLLDQPEYFDLRQEHLLYLDFYDIAKPFRKQNEHKYQAIATQLWDKLDRWDSRSVFKISQEIGASYRFCVWTVLKWKKLGLIHIYEINKPDSRLRNFFASRLVNILPPIVYSSRAIEWSSVSNNRPSKTESKPIKIYKNGMSQTQRAKRIYKIKNKQGAKV